MVPGSRDSGRGARPRRVPVLQSTPRTTDDARLRRVQALAPGEPVGLGVARYLLSAKVAGQARLVGQRFADRDGVPCLSGMGEIFEERSATIADLGEAINCAETIGEARQLEASAAALYFATWTGRPETAPSFAARDRGRVPALDHLREPPLSAR
jgi:CRISPR/Cas system-associated endonuclease Cas1